MAADQEELQAAVYELHQFLSDQKPPLMVADSIGLLMRYPAKLMAAQIDAWVGAQALAAPVADYLYHGAKKISLMGDLDLIPHDELAGYMRALAPELLAFCPEPDRELLKQNLDRLGQAVTAGAIGATGVLHVRGGQPSAPAAAPPAADRALTREVRRLSLLLERLRPLASVAAPPEQRTELASRFMSTAAVEASSASELDQRLAPLRDLGIQTATEDVFRTLARSLAGWLLPRTEGGPAPASGEQLEAMHRIVSLAEDPAEAAKRLREMVHAAIEQLNEGHLGRAVHMIELAERLVAEQKVKPVFVDALRTQGHTYLNQEVLRRYAERAESRPQLRAVLSFFTALQPAALLQALDGEPRREHRHELLALLEAHGADARREARALLQQAVEDASRFDAFFPMNLVYLLRIIPRPDDVPVEAEVDAVMHVAGRSSPPPVVKQVIAYLATTRHERSERALMTYLRVFESMLLQPETSVYPLADLDMLLDRTCAALARYGTPRAWRLLIDHGLKSEARLGSPFLRLAEAGRVDLSASRELVERVIAAIRAEVPKGGMRALLSRGNEDRAVALVQALAGTPLPEVVALCEELAASHPDRKLGQAAAKASALLAASREPPPPAGLSGDLDVFGLPNLLQTVAQSSLTGVLSLITRENKTEATLVFEKGRFRGGQCGSVLGEEALYQLFEKPFPGTFAFVSRADVASLPRAGEPQDMFPLLMEGVRRYDEYRRAAAVVADGARLTATARPRTQPDDEDPDFADLLWRAATAGKSPLECETAVSIDSYRVRRLLAHWIEEGSLQPA